MNILPPEKVQEMRAAFDRGAGTRAAARECGVNRETVARYFTQWRHAKPESWTDFLVSVAGRLSDPGVIKVIDDEIRRIDAEIEEIRTLRKMAVRRHGESLMASFGQ